MTNNKTDHSVYSELDQYFPADIIKLENAECFVDGGAYEGDTIYQLKRLSKKAKLKEGTIVAFEPDRTTFKKLQKHYPGVVCYNTGIWSKNTVLNFSGGATGTSCVVDGSASGSATDSYKIKVQAIDSIPECQGATFIKMDIEGSELEALKGARATILRNRPKLAICIYHRNEDFINIPMYIHSLVPEYKLYVRQHSDGNAETVLYAIL